MVLNIAERRKSGIEPVGDIPWGSHFCQFYQTQQDLLDILVPYFKTGLENNEFCMWVTAHPLNAGQAREALKEAVPDLERYEQQGQLEILPHDRWYMLEGLFDQERVLNGWVSRLDGAREKGFDAIPSGWREKPGTVSPTTKPPSTTSSAATA